MLGLIDHWQGAEVLVVGDLLLDAYVDGRATRICREAPVPVVELQGESAVPGGAGNAAANLAALGARVTVAGVVGADDAGRSLLEALEGAGVDTRAVVWSRSRRTRVARRVRCDGHVVARLDEGSMGDLSATDAAALVRAVRGRLRRGVGVLVSDYAHGVGRATGDALATHRARRPDAVVVVDAKDPSAHVAVRPTAVKPNWDEAARLLGLPAGAGADGEDDARPAIVAAHGDRLLDLTGAGGAVVTLDRAGSVVIERRAAPHRIHAAPRPHLAAIGAGDTFSAVLTLALLVGATTTAAAELAAAASAAVLDQPGTASCGAARLREAIAPVRKVASNLDEVRATAASARARGQRIAFTCGCFDLLHRGHVALLDHARSLGDVLVVGVNDDAGARRLKGPGRPVQPLADRLAVLAGLSSVDLLVPFSGPSPADVLRALRPDLEVKGPGHRLESLAEGSTLRRLGIPLIVADGDVGPATSAILERIRSERPLRAVAGSA